MSGILSPAKIREFTRHVGLGRLTGDAGAVALGQLSSFVYPLVSIPFLSRLLGAHELGRLIFAMSLIQVIIYVVDFGFGMSALRAVAVAAGGAERARVVGATLGAQLLLLAGCAAVFLPAIFLIPALRVDWELLVIGLALVLGEVAFPTWLLLGLGRMKTFAVVTAVSRLVALAGLLLTVRTAGDVDLAMFWQFIPLSIAAALCWGYLARAGLARLRPASRSEIIRTLKESAPLFVSSMATMVMGAANSVVLGAFSTLHQVAYFGTAERMSNAARGILSGVGSAVLPRVTTAETETGDVRLRHTVMAAIIVCSTGAGLTMMGTAQWLIPWYLGGDFAGAVPIARLLGAALCVTGLSSAFTLVLVARNQFHTLSRVMSIVAAAHLVLLPIGCHAFGGLGAASAVLVTDIVLALLLAWAYRATGRARHDAPAASAMASRGAA